MASKVGKASQAKEYARQVKSNEASRMLSELLALPVGIRHEVLKGTGEAEWMQLLMAAERDMGTAYGLWQDDPLDFVETVVGESLWEKPKEIFRSIPSNRRIAVPSCFASSKSHSASRAVLWWACVYPPSTVKVVTLAPKWSQVETIIWPEIRKAHARAGLPGYVDMTQMKIPYKGVDVKVAYGLPANPQAESSIQGQHGANMFIVVDEAGGVGHLIGSVISGLETGMNTRLLCIGNPAADEENTWFETFCGRDSTKVIPISAYDTPNMTGEKVGRCKSCPPEVPEHPLSEHLVQRFQIEEMIEDHGEDSNFVAAKVHARFSSGGTNRVIPSSWVESAATQPIPADTVKIGSLGLLGESSDTAIKLGAWVRLGIDVAADGGDEFSICRLIGDAPEIVHHSAGRDNESAVDVAGVCLDHILRAERLANRIGASGQVEVKIDGIGVGWGVASLLDRWGQEGRHSSRIVTVVVSEKPKQEPDASTLRPFNQRAEMWLAMRVMLEPNKQTGETGLRLNWLDHKTIAQFSGPKKLTNSSGYTQIEAKAAMKSRGIKSPDRCESVILALYSPQPAPRRGRILSI